MALNWLDVVVFFSFWTKITFSLLLVFFVNAFEENSSAWAGWRSYELCVCQNPNLLFILFSGCVILSFFLLLFPSCRHFSDFSLPQRRSHQWFLLFGVNIPNVSLFINCIPAITERLCWGCAKHATTGNHNTDHSARLGREMLNLTISSCSVCLRRCHKGFCLKLYNVEKIIIINYCHMLLTASGRGWWFVKE